MNRNTKNRVTQNCALLSVRLIIVLGILFTTNNAFADAMINIYELQEDGNYKAVNENVEVTAQLIGIESAEKVELEYHSSGVFSYLGSDNEWVKLEIVDDAGEIYMRKILPSYYMKGGLEINLYIGKSDYLSFNKGVIKPFSPDLDKLIIDYSSSRNQGETREGLSKLGVFPTPKNGVYVMKHETFSRKEQLKKLLSRMDLDFIAPIYKNEGNFECQFFSNRVDFLLNNNLTEEAVKRLFNNALIKEFVKSPLSGGLKNYQNCIAYNVTIPEKIFVDYHFLKTLKELYENDNVLMVSTNTTSFTRTN